MSKDLAKIWCLNCGQVHTRKEWKRNDDNCPTKGCLGDVFADGIGWDAVREMVPGYPEEPEDGIVYPLNGREAV